MMFPDNSDERVFSPSSSLQALQSVSNNFRIRQSEGIFLRQGARTTSDLGEFQPGQSKNAGDCSWRENVEIFVIKIFFKNPSLHMT